MNQLVVPAPPCSVIDLENQAESFLKRFSPQHLVKIQALDIEYLFELAICDEYQVKTGYATDLNSGRNDN